ncbi:MAG TPA: DUF1206 domain-containing protein [Candidatus Dormibacteraeota bacterium]|jgi:hypothetical protein
MIRGHASEANQGAKAAAANPFYMYAARAGYVARGVLYGYMGYAALKIAQTGGSRPADQKASLIAVAGFPLGRFILVAGIVAIAAYSAWGFIRAIYDPLHRGHDPQGIVTRLGFAWSGLSYLVLVFFAFGLLTNGGTGGNADGMQQMAAKLMSVPAGILLTEAAGLIGLAAGFGQFFEAYRASFKKDEKRGRMSEAEKRITDTLGRAGFVARGVVFALMGWFIFLAARQHNSGKATGFTGIFTFILAQPYGRPLLALVALGIIALGLHSVVLARYIRLPGDSA